MNDPYLDRRLRGPWAQRGQLFIPPTVPQRHGEMDNIKVFVKYSDLFDRTPTFDEFVARLRRCGLHSVMQSLSALMQILYNDGVATPRLQPSLAVRSLTPAGLERLRRLPDVANQVVFFPQQILLTMKLALLHSPDAADERPDLEFGDDLVEILLMASDLLDDIGIPGGTAATERILLSYIVRNFLLNTTDQFRYMLPRAALLYVTLPNDPELQRDPSFVDVPAVFRQATGFELRDFIALGLALFPWFIDQSELRGTFTQERRSINPSTYFRNARLDPQIATLLLETLSHTHESLVADLNARIAQRPTTLCDGYDFLPFMRKPLYRLREDVIVPIHLGYLAAKFSGGIYWTVFDYLAGKDRLRFSTFFGRVFELYVRRSVQRAIPDHAALARRVFPEFIYRTRTGERKTSDVIIVYDRAAIFIEATASRIKMEDTAITGNLAAFDSDVEKIVFGKARQLTERIRDFRDGLYTIGGLTPTELPRIYPVIATLQQLPESSITWRYFKERLQNEGSLQAEGVEPLQILDIEEIEILEGLLSQGLSLRDILDRRMADPQRRYISMKNSLIAAIGERGVNEYMQGQYRELGTQTLDLLFHPE
jgi:hypothetical protein